MRYGPKGTPVHRQKGQKTRISPLKRTIVHAELLAILCGVSKRSIMKYFSNERLELSNPRAVRKRLEARYKKFGSLTGPEKEKKTKYVFKEPEQQIQGPSYPTE